MNGIAPLKKRWAAEDKRKNKQIPNFWEHEYYYNFMYYSSGLYSEQVKRFMDLFNNNLLILKFDQLIADPQGMYNRVCQFLDIVPGTISQKKFNPSQRVLSPKRQFITRRFITLKMVVQKRLLGKKQFAKDERDLLIQRGIKKREAPANE